MYMLHVKSLSHNVNGTSHFNPSLLRFLYCNLGGFIEGWELGKFNGCVDDICQETLKSGTLTKLKMLRV